MKNQRIYIDTNVLNNYFTKQTADVQCLNYLFSKVRKEILFTSSLAVVQTVSLLQKARKGRKAFSYKEAVASGEKIYSKFSVIDLSSDDVKAGFQYQSKDIEDNVHYVLSQKLKCSIIITNNISDYSYFRNILSLSPSDITSIRRIVK
jgi:predicted nucleic acid-binding protein